jgi:lipoprotein-anchoring transpeptidase ErfK/SrfK
MLKLGSLGMRSVFLAALFVAFATAGASAAIVAKISISQQTMTVSEDGNVLYSWSVSTGGKGYRTPRGTYRPVRMAKMWYSRKYDNAPMPNSIFFKGGYAIHGTNHIKSLGRPASHGCVRLHPANAKVLYELVRAHGPRNTRIVLTD